MHKINKEFTSPTGWQMNACGGGGLISHRALLIRVPCTRLISLFFSVSLSPSLAVLLSSLSLSSVILSDSRISHQFNTSESNGPPNPMTDFNCINDFVVRWRLTQRAADSASSSSSSIASLNLIYAQLTDTGTHTIASYPVFSATTRILQKCKNGRFDKLPTQNARIFWLKRIDIITNSRLVHLFFFILPLCFPTIH